jgi:hypothetical protein
MRKFVEFVLVDGFAKDSCYPYWRHARACDNSGHWQRLWQMRRWLSGLRVPFAEISQLSSSLFLVANLSVMLPPSKIH